MSSLIKIPRPSSNTDETSSNPMTNPGLWEALEAELVYIQDRSGKYLSFYGDIGEQLTIEPEDVIGFFPEQSLKPVSPEAYYKRIKRVLDRKIPEQCYCEFEYRNQTFALELVISPILQKKKPVTTVLVMGHFLADNEISVINNSALPTHPEPYQKLLTKIARQIRRTLNLETIWQQTVDSLGEALQVSRCLMISMEPQQEYLDVKAEYCNPCCVSELGVRFIPEDDPWWEKVLNQREPLIFERLMENSSQIQSNLIVSTFYQNQRNGLICLQQYDRSRYWSPGEIELIQELADQVGTAIAHATLYQELEQATLAAEEASRLKSDFLASTTHELRTPLNGIIGFLKLILDGMADDAQEQQEFLEEAHKSALHLLNLINDILDIAKIEAGKMDLNLGAVELAELFDAVDKFTLPQTQRKHLEFRSKLPSTLTPIMVSGNYQRLLQVMFNLVSNAIKFTHEGSVVVNAEIVKKKIHHQNQEFPGLVKVSVTDTGIGVALDKQDQLFEKFVQVDGSHTKAYGGTGLGLAISQKLVEAMGGQVEFYSMGEGLGSTVTFTVPLEQMPVIKTVKPF
ncbi:sensor histidine kinase [Crocosphaera sp. Alani8]|uniref:sensor histidine kinase n=1 Tax=Crocosphaera sp. Alani8 TaxID=3038952 RepID=UPI00313C69FD